MLYTLFLCRWVAFTSVSEDVVNNLLIRIGIGGRENDVLEGLVQELFGVGERDFYGGESIVFPLLDHCLVLNPSLLPVWSNFNRVLCVQALENCLRVSKCVGKSEDTF